MIPRLVSIIIFYCLIAVSVKADPEISLNGTVKDKDDVAIAEAVIALASNPTLTDTTNTNGEFTLSNFTSIFKSEESSISNRTISKIGIKGGQFQFFISSYANHGIISIFCGNGKKSAVISLSKIESGIHKITLPKLASGIYLMNITIDQLTKTWKLINEGNKFFITDNIAEVNHTDKLSLKGTVGSVDTLIVTKTGFETTQKEITSYLQTGIEIELKPEVKRPVYAYAATVENTCADCEVPELPSPDKLPKIQKLPDPFKKIDGTRITKKSEWSCRRQEILKQAMKYIYGEKPEPPEVVNGTVTENKITVHVEDNGKTIDFSLDIVLPSTGKGPFPAIINVGAKGPFGGIGLGESRILNQGVAVIYYDYSKVGKEKQDASAQIRTTDKQGLFYNIYGGRHSAGLLVAWAWGASRIIDVLQNSDSDIIDYTRLGVTGCSRTAKGAFAIGLFDERIALTLPHETSLGGIPAYRIADAKCQENTQNNFNGQEWLSDNFKPFVMNSSQLPIDAHELVATFAPRGLYSMENPSAAQMCAPGGNMSIQGGAEIYKALGVAENLSYNSKTPNGTAHCTYTDNFTEPLINNISKFLKHESAETGKIEAGATFTRSDWIDWNSPTLENDTDIYGNE